LTGLALTEQADVARRRSTPIAPAEHPEAVSQEELRFRALSQLARVTAQELEAANEALRVQAVTDPLTGAHNRRGFMDRSGAEIERCERYGHELVLAMLDIDHFKRVNDTLGHAAGDAVLAAVAAELQRASRETDVVVRWGGEEFLFVFPNTDLSKGVAVVERFRTALAALPIEVPEGDPVKVTISGGVAELERSDTVDSLVARADDALYRAKESGRNRLMIWQLGKLMPVPAA
jgi:diguanylate cyclase